MSALQCPNGETMDNQSGVIFGFIAVAFFVYITLKGELPIYAGLLLLSPQSSGTTSAAAATTNQATSLSQGAQASQNATAAASFLSDLAIF